MLEDIKYMIPWANFFGCLGYVIAAIFFYVKASKEDFSKRKLLVLIILGFCTFCFAGKIIPFLYRWFILKTWLPFLNEGNMSYSNILASILVGIAFCRINKWKVYKILDIYALANLLQASINRIGCFLNGCCVGKSTTLPWGYRFTTKPIFVDPNVLRHPTQIYSSIANLLLFFILLRFYNKNRKFNGQVFWLYVCYYSIFRFFIEFIRINPIFWLRLTHAQWFSLFAIILSKTALSILKKRRA